MIYRTYDILEEPRGGLYRDLVDFCLPYSMSVQLVLPSTFRVTPSIIDFINKHQKSLVTKEESTEWPGTKLIGHKATLYHYRSAPDFHLDIKLEVEGLYEWLTPERLEDICFMRADGTPMLATITHEEDAFMELTDTELRELLKALPDLKIKEHEKATEHD